MEKTISFSVNGNEISGKLHGNAHLWMFESENEFFRSNCSNGTISKHSFTKANPAFSFINKIYSVVCAEAELPML